MDEDALVFYERMDFAPTIIETLNELADILLPLITVDKRESLKLVDGTPAIIEKLTGLL
jgi:hypothetical protein